MKAIINKNLFKTNDGYVVVTNEPIERGDWIYSTDNNTSSRNVFKIDENNPIGFGGNCYNTKQGVGVLINSCKKIFITIGFKLDDILHVRLPNKNINEFLYIETLLQDISFFDLFKNHPISKRTKKALKLLKDLKEKYKYTEDDLIEIVEDLKHYTHESQVVLGYDERDASEFIDIFLAKNQLPYQIKEIEFETICKRKLIIKNIK